MTPTSSGNGLQLFPGLCLFLYVSLLHYSIIQLTSVVPAVNGIFLSENLLSEDAQVAKKMIYASTPLDISVLYELDAASTKRHSCLMA